MVNHTKSQTIWGGRGDDHTKAMNGVIATNAQTTPICHYPLSTASVQQRGGSLTLARLMIWLLIGSGTPDSVVKSRKGESGPIPEVLLNTVAMMVKASVPPKGRATAMSDTTVAMCSGKKPMTCREAGGTTTGQLR